MKSLPPQPPLRDIYDALYVKWGPQGWWPASTDFEMCVGAILVQQTAWGNVEKAIENLRRADVLTPRAIFDMDRCELEMLIRPSGFYRVKAVRLQAFCNLICMDFGGRLEALLALDGNELRRRLLSVHGIGRETADCILLYAAGVPRFVVDAYTRRVVERHGWLDRKASYEDVAKWFAEGLGEDVPLFQEFHALLVELGKQHCRTKPQCETCPLRRWLPVSS